MKWFTKITLGVLDALLIVLTILLVFDTFFQVINRFLFQLPISWTEEIARYLSIWISLLGAARCTYMSTHMNVGIIFDKFSPRIQKWLFIIGDALTLWFVTVVLTKAIKILPLVGRQIAPASRIRLYWVYSAAPVAAALMAYFLLLNLFKLFSHKASTGVEKGGVSE